MSRSLGRTAQIGPLFSKIGTKLFAGDDAVSSAFDSRAMLGWNISARHPRPNCLMANSDQIGERLLRPGDLNCSGDVVMEAHNRHSTTVECKGQQLCIENLQMRSSLPPMNMGKRLKQELADRGMDPIELCERVPEMGIGTLSAMYTRDSQWSKFAPAIAKALNLELEWLLTGEGRKERLDQSGMTRLSEADQQFMVNFYDLTEEQRTAYRGRVAKDAGSNRWKKIEATMAMKPLEADNDQAAEQ